MAATVERWQALGLSVGGSRAMFEQQWHELRMAVEMDRVTVVDWEPPSSA